MPAKYTPAPEVKKIAEELIPDYHPHLEGQRVEYVFVDTIPNKGGKQVWGTMRKISSLPAYLAFAGDADSEDVPPFFCMVITKPVWEQLPDKSKVALVDHELCHATLEEDKLKVAPHDLEEFTAIVERYGLWRKDIQDFITAATADK